MEIDDWQHFKLYYAWIWKDYKKMFIKTSLWALMLESINLLELKYGYRKDISVGGFPVPLHICSFVYGNSQYNHHFSSLHALNIHIRGLYFTSSPVRFISIWAEKSFILQCGFICTEKSLFVIMGFLISLFVFLPVIFVQSLSENLLFPFHRFEFSERLKS